MLFYHNLDGRIDYPFLLHRSYDKVIKKVHIYVPSLEDNFVNVEVDSLTTVGEIVDEIGKSYNITNALDFGLIVKYNGQERILDRDEFLGDTIVNTKIKFQEV